MRRTIAAGLLAIALAGCGSGGHAKPAVKPSPSPSPSSDVAGPATFLKEARASDFGSKDMASGSDDSLLAVGNSVCSGFTNGLTYGQVSQGILQATAKPTVTQVDRLVRSAVGSGSV